MRLAMWLQRHPRFWRLARLPFVQDRISRYVWGDLEADPGFRAGIAEGLAALHAHRTYVWDMDTGIVSPDPRWPKDGPQPKPPYNYLTNEPL